MKSCLETVQSLCRGFVDVNSTNTSLCARVGVVEPDSRVGISDRECEGSNGRAVVRVAEARVEAVDGLVRYVRWDARRRKCRLDSSVISLRDWIGMTGQVIAREMGTVPAYN